MYLAMYESYQFCRWMVTVKMSINSAKCWFAVDKGCRFALLTDYIYFKKGHSAVFSFCITGDMLTWRELK